MWWLLGGGIIWVALGVAASLGVVLCGIIESGAGRASFAACYRVVAHFEGYGSGRSITANCATIKDGWGGQPPILVARERYR